MSGTEIAVIGGGIIGAAALYRLARAGVRATLLDAGEPGHGTSASSFAWLNSARKTPRAYHDLNVAGMAEHSILAGELADAPWLHRDGGLAWATTPAGHAHAREHAARLNAWGYRVESLDPARAARELEPGLMLDPALVDEVWYTPGEGWADVPLLIRTLLARAGELGATIRSQAPVVAIDHASGRVTGLRLAGDERIAADAVVICAGPRAAEVAALASVTLPVGRVPGLLAVTAPVAGRPRHVCVAETITFRPDPSGGLVLAHADDLDATVAADTPLEPLPPATAELLARAARVLPAAARTKVTAARIGVRPMPADGLTIAGRLPAFANCHVAVTHSGITLGPLLGRLIAEEIASGTPPAQLAPFRPERFT